MKKILFLLPFLLTLAHADTQTSGNLKLLQPTTGQAFDPNDASKRSWGDKFNKNFQIIDSSLTTVMGQLSAVAVNTTTINGRFANVATDTTTLKNRFDVVAADTQTLSNRPSVISIYNSADVFQGNATSIKVNTNLTVAMVGSTATISATASGGASQKAYDMIVGSYGAIGTDAIVENVNQWNLVLASFNARGLTHSTTAQARYLFTHNTALMGGATVPAGIKVFMDSSTWIDNGTTVSQFLRVYGTIKGVTEGGGTLDLAGIAFNSSKIELSSFSKLIDIDIVGGHNQAGAVVNSHALTTSDGSIGIEVANVAMRGAVQTAGVLMYGDACPVRIKNTSMTAVDFREYRPISAGVNNRTNMQMQFSTATTLSGNLYGMTGNGINMAQGCIDCGLTRRPNGRRSYMEYNTDSLSGDIGAIVIGDSNGTNQGTSTRPYVSDWDIVNRTPDTAVIIRVNNAAGKETISLLLQNLTIRCTNATSNSMTAITLGGGALNTVINDVDVYGCNTALTDSGRNTIKAGLRKNAVAQ